MEFSFWQPKIGSLLTFLSPNHSYNHIKIDCFLDNFLSHSLITHSLASHRISDILHGNELLQILVISFYIIFMADSLILYPLFFHISPALLALFDSAKAIHLLKNILDRKTNFKYHLFELFRFHSDYLEKKIE